MPSSRPRRRASLRALAALASAGALALTLTGCIGAPAPSPMPTPSSSSEPIFASDQEALAAAEAAYQEYVTAINTISREGNNAPERMREVATAEWAAHVQGLIEDFAQRGLTIEGATTVDSFRLLEVAQLHDVAEVSFLVCSDVGETRIINLEGVDVTPPDRPVRSALQVKAVSNAAGAALLLVDEEAPWSGDYC